MDHVLMIAEAGVNHNGDFELAKQMIDVAKEAGADVIKFQTSTTSTSKYSEKAEYQKCATGRDESQLDMIKKLRFTFDQHRDLKNYCEQIGIEYLSTPFDFESIDFLKDLCRFWKVPSGEIVNIPYLEKIGETGKPVVMSTGMASLAEIQRAISVLEKAGTSEVTLLQCTTEYPVDFKDINLNCIQTMRKQFKCKTGFSDHSLGIEASVAAVALGACVIEKHFTLDRNMEGPDQKASLEPQELKALVRAIRNVEQALGTGEKKPCEAELKNLHAARKSIVAKIDIKKGDQFTVDNIVPRHAGNGISPACWYEVLGQSAIRDFKEDEMIEI